MASYDHDVLFIGEVRLRISSIESFDLNYNTEDNVVAALKGDNDKIFGVRTHSGKEYRVSALDQKWISPDIENDADAIVSAIFSKWISTFKD